MPFLLLSIIKNETFFHKRRREWRKRKKEPREKRGQDISSRAAYQIHNTQALRFAPNDLCDVISLLAAVTVLLMQAEKSDSSWCMLQNLCI
jgi:hypothetical protein